MHNSKNVIYSILQEKYGKNAQLAVACEELAELIVEVAKHINNKRDDTIGLIDELADSRIMIEQVEHLFKIEDAVTKRMELKLEQIERKLI